MTSKEQLNEILEQLNRLTADVKDLIAKENEEVDDDLEEIVIFDSPTIELHAGKGYTSHVTLLSQLADTENGFIFYFPSYSSCVQDNYICMDYSEADYVYKLMKAYYKKPKE